MTGPVTVVGKVGGDVRRPARPRDGAAMASCPAPGATFSGPVTGRPVVDDVRARFRFADGLIAAQVDA